MNNLPKVRINDIHKRVGENMEKFLSVDQLQLSQEGQMACAPDVPDSISTFL